MLTLPLHCGDAPRFAGIVSNHRIGRVTRVSDSDDRGRRIVLQTALLLCAGPFDKWEAPGIAQVQQLYKAIATSRDGIWHNGASMHILHHTMYAWWEVGS